MSSFGAVFGLLITLALCAPGLLAQRMLLGASTGTPLHLFGSDLAVLEAGETRNDLPCTVTMGKPVLGFDMKYHVGYEVTVPLAELEGSDNLLTILFRVGGSEASRPAHFTHKIHVPSIEEGTKGDAYFTGTFDIGEGSYKVGWLMRDRAERVCANFFDVEAALPDKEKEMKLDLPAGAISQTQAEQFGPEPPISRQAEDSLNIKVLVNFAPQNEKSATLQAIDTQALVSILRGIHRDPRVGRFSVVAFNMQEQKVLYRSDNADHIDFPAIGKALDSLKLGTIDLARLSQKDGETRFLAGLLRSEMATSGSYDAVVFAGPKAMLESNVPQEALKDVGEVNCPVFYMNYNLYPTQIPWRDSIGSAVRYFRGQEYTINRPRDLWRAVSEMFGHVVKSRRVKSTVSAASSE